jgi:UDP-N-acetylglucosamine--N-acetylmuramyl-(pentapeptide) pyrophosphoryl-undecaprenol N-acetylglucosamine transferase
VVLFAGGGTGGHVLPGVAAAERLRAMAPGARCLFATTERDAAGAWADAAPAERLPIASPRLPRGAGEVASFLRGFAASLRDSVLALRRLGVDGVVGLGGYGSVGPTLAALATDRPAVVLEANVVPGAANRWLAHLGATPAVAFEETGALLPWGTAVHTGNPLRAAVLESRRDAAAFGLDPSAPVLGVLGGSLGARGLNARVAAALPWLVAEGVQLLWAAGAEEAAAMERAAKAAGARASVMPFCREMGLFYGTADVLLARAGGGTVAEISALGVPSVLVPYPHHADRQQVRNAEALASRGAARMVEEADLSPHRLAEEVLPLLRDGAARDRMAAAARACGRPDAADRVARLVLDRVAEGRRE